jgi:hypothetical protein
MITVDPAGAFTVVFAELASTDAGTTITFVAGSVPVIVSEEGCAE